jgi:hypothetical protein
MQGINQGIFDPDPARLRKHGDNGVWRQQSVRFPDPASCSSERVSSGRKDERVGEAGELDDPAKQRPRSSKFHDRDPLGDGKQHRKAGTVHELESAKVENDPIRTFCNHPIDGRAHDVDV